MSRFFTSHKHRNALFADKKVLNTLRLQPPQNAVPYILNGIFSLKLIYFATVLTAEHLEESFFV